MCWATTNVVHLRPSLFDEDDDDDGNVDDEVSENLISLSFVEHKDENEGEDDEEKEKTGNDSEESFHRRSLSPSSFSVAILVTSHNSTSS